MLEILAPAGNAESAKAALNNGANAIYLGYSAFSARQNAENFTLDSLSEIIKEAHFLGAKIYIAMNTIIKNEELDEFLKTLISVWNLGVDAVIMQDIFLGRHIKTVYPQIELHLSTQAGICNANGARLAKEYGFSRVIVARETPIEDIAEIAKIIETEAFVQGALCTCFSGQCYFSSFAGGNSGNRGRCKQPCRKKYAYNRSGYEEKNYALSLSDLSVGEDIQKLAAIGVTSFKIEGRMRRAEYVAAAVRYYRALLDGLPSEQALSDLKRTYNRGNYTKGLAFGQDKRFLSTLVQGHIGEKVGTVNVVNGNYTVESLFSPSTGDAFKVLREGVEVGGATFSKKLPRGFAISSKARLRNGDGVFVTTDGGASERVLSSTHKIPVKIRLQFHENQLAKIEGEGITVYSSEPLQTATGRALTGEELCACFGKTDGLPVIADISVDLVGNIFIAKSQLNAIRREFYEKLIQLRTKNINTPYEYTPTVITPLQGANGKIAVMSDDFTGITADIAVYKPLDYTASLPKSFIEGSFEKFIYYPALCTASDELQIIKRLSETESLGVYAENYSALAFAKRQGVKVFVGTGFNLLNTLSIQTLLQEDCVAYYAISKEANYKEAEVLISSKAFALSMGNIKIMDLCYCPFGKKCSTCDKKNEYRLTDENAREFPVRRYIDGRGACRFEVYNCADLIGEGVAGGGKLLDLSLVGDKKSAIAVQNDTEKQKSHFNKYTSGHYKRGVL